MKSDVLVLGAGIVGVSVAIHLVKRGRSVVLVDRQGAGEATSFGNAGLIQREGVAPHLFPQDMQTLLKYARNQSTSMRFQWRALPRISRFLAQRAQVWLHGRLRNVANARRLKGFIAHRDLLVHL